MTENQYPDRTGKSEFIDVIDLTPSIQTQVDWVRVKEAGFRGVIIQCSRYSRTPELAYDKYAEAASRAGLAVGGYHFAACDSSAVEQARFFLRNLKRTGIGLRPGDIPPCMDLEYAKLTLADKGPDYVVQWGCTFMETLEAEGGKVPIWYTFPFFADTLQPFLGKSDLATRWRLHLARYWAQKGPTARFYPKDGQRPTLVPKGVPEANVCLWQYSGNVGYPVPGIAGACDRNVFIGSQGDWAEFLGLERPVSPGVTHQTSDDIAHRP